MNEREAHKNENNTESESSLNYYLKDKWKLGVTLFCLFSFITMGLHLEISGSTMFPLSVQVGTNLSRLSWIIVSRSFGYMIVVAFFGIIFQSITKTHSELMLAIGYLFPAAATALTPYLKSLWTLCVALLFQGMSHAISDLAINTLVTTMWSTHSTAPLNCVYSGYTIGALLSIIIVRSFRQNNILIYQKIKSSNSTIIFGQGEFQSDLVGPYRIASIFCLISSIGFALIAYKQNEYKNKSKVEKIRVYQSVAKEEINVESKPKRIFNKATFWKTCSPTTCGQGYLAYGFILMFLLLLYNFFFGGIEQSFTKFFISFIEQQHINLNPNDAIYSMIFYWLPMLIGRIVCTFLTALWLSPQILLTISLFLCLLTYLLWIIFIWYIGLSRLSVFILVTMNGLSISSLSPTTIGWIKQFLSLTPIELSFLISSNAFGGIVFGLISGYVFQYSGSEHLFTVLILAIILCSTSFWLASIFQLNHSKQQNRNEIIHQEEITFIKPNQPELILDDYTTIKYIDQ